MSDSETIPKKRRWLRIALLAAVLWIVLAPNWIAEWAVGKVLMAKLNDPETGISCERVKFSGFRCWKLLFMRDPGKLEIKGVKYDSARLNLKVGHNEGDKEGRLTISGVGSALDWRFCIDGKADVSWKDVVSVAGDLKAVLLDGDEETPYKVDVNFDASASGWRAYAHVPEFEFSESDAVMGRLVSRTVSDSVSNLTFRGFVAADVFARQTNSMKVATWSLDASLRNVSVSADMGGSSYSLNGLFARPSASGLAGHIDCAPLRVHAKSLDAAGIVLTNVYADVRNDAKKLFVAEANAGICGGTVSLYALSIDPEKLNAGVTLFASDLDAGEVLAHLNGFQGKATGHLHGRIPIFFRNGSGVRLGDAFLCSTPGETGELKISDPSLIVDNLRAGGVDANTCKNISSALEDLKYKVLKLDFKNAKGRDATLSVKLEGDATAGGKTVPVNIDVNVNGPIESLLNFGIRASKIK